MTVVAKFFESKNVSVYLTFSKQCQQCVYIRLQAIVVVVVVTSDTNSTY